MKPIIRVEASWLLLTVIFLSAACSKDTGLKNMEPTEPPSPATATPKQDSLNAFRTGQTVSLEWDSAPVNDARSATVYRSATGPNEKLRVATLEPSAKNYEDTLPDRGPHWYWIYLKAKGNTSKIIGPVRVPPDNDTTNPYVDETEKYKVNITRTDEIATITWDFPDDEYSQIRLSRYTTPVSKPAIKLNNILTIIEWKSRYKNPLPDINTDYWYWFEIILKSGRIIHIGPFKAVYAE